MGQPQQKYFKLDGGLDLVTSPIKIDPGRLILVENYEQGILGGYTRIDGFERTDGRTLPSNASYWVLNFDAGNFPTTGQLGSDLVTNGAFTTASDWLFQGTWAISAGVAAMVNDIGGKLIYQDAGLEYGKRYQVTFTIVDITEGGLRVQLGSSQTVLGTIRTSPGTYTENISNTSSTSPELIGIRTVGETTASIDNVTCKEIIGTVDLESDQFVVGQTSGASGKVLNSEVTSGDYSLGTAAGYVVLYEVSGTFVDNETVAVTNSDPGFGVGFSGGFS